MKPKNGEKSIPNSYLENTHQENYLLELADNFHRQFKYLYPKRIKPPLYLENECKVNKLIFTSLCPLKVTMPIEMRNWDFCANFFADFFHYETLSPPVECPQQLSSVERILKTRKGNSLDLSTVLCTFLLASGYEAYVVQGYARRNICEKLEGRETKPSIMFDTNSEYHKLYFTSLESKEINTRSNKYEMNFKLLKSFWLEGKSVFQPMVDEPEDSEEEFEEDVLLGQRIHFWVLMFGYEDGTINSFFIEPTTGEMKPVQDSHYLGIEFLWNHHNFWCNCQQIRETCKDIRFDFTDTRDWETFLPDYSITGEFERSMAIPESWVKEVEITGEDLKNRFPREGRKIHYKKAIVEKYNQGALRNGLVYGVTYYQTEEKQEPVEKYAFFSKRKDRLEFRKTNFTKKTVKDVFSVGREDSLKEHNYPLSCILHFPQEMIFYSSTRKDQLSCRMWDDNVTKDVFVGRSDLLLAREVHYALGTAEVNNQVNSETTEIEETAEKSENETDSEKTAESSTENTEEEMVKNGIVSQSQLEGTEVPTSEETVEIPERKQSIAFEITVDEGEEIVLKGVEDVSVGIGPSSFDADVTIFEGVDFSSWNFEFFLDEIDPAERYATTESDSDEEKAENSISNQEAEQNLDDSEKNIDSENGKNSEVGSETTINNQEQILQDINEAKEGVEKNKELETQTIEENELYLVNEEESNKTMDVFKEESVADEGEVDKDIGEANDRVEKNDDFETKMIHENEGELDKEMEIYDEINFDALSDEELEIDYQLFLSELWEEHKHDDDKELFYMTREFYNHKDLRSRDILKLKKKIIKKRRRNVRYLQRMEFGKPSVRIYKRKSAELLDRQKSPYTDDFITYLNLRENLGIESKGTIKEFHEIDMMEKIYADAANAEVIKKECLKLLDKKISDEKRGKVSSDRLNIRYIKNSYVRDQSMPVEHAVENVWFNIEEDGYRLDFHYPENRSSRKVLIFTKPESGSTNFNFSDHLCREILPSYVDKRTKRSQMYSYLVTLIKKEPLLLRDLSRFEKEMQRILETRDEEEKFILKRQKKIGKIPLKRKFSDEAIHEHSTGVESVGELSRMISYEMERLNLSLPLSEDEGKLLYRDIFNEFCKEAVRKFRLLEDDYNTATEDFGTFLEKCKNWDEELNDEQEQNFTDTCGKFSALMSSIKYRCEAQREVTKSNFISLKRELCKDPKLQTFINKMKETQKL